LISANGEDSASRSNQQTDDETTTAHRLDVDKCRIDGLVIKAAACRYPAGVICATLR